MAESDVYCNVVMNLDEFNISNKTLFLTYSQTLVDNEMLVYKLVVFILELLQFPDTFRCV